MPFLSPQDNIWEATKCGDLKAIYKLMSLKNHRYLAIKLNESG